MAKRKVIRAYAWHKKYGCAMEPFDLELNKDTAFRFESDGKVDLGPQQRFSVHSACGFYAQSCKLAA